MKESGTGTSFNLRRAGDQEVFPTDACNAVAPGNLFIAGAQMTSG